MKERPIIAMTMGDAAGVGPEVLSEEPCHAWSFALVGPSAGHRRCGL